MRKVPGSAITGPLGGAMCSIESFSSTVVIPQRALATIARRVPDRRKRTRKGARSPVRASSTSSRYAPKSSTATPTVWRTPGISPSVSQAANSVKAGLKVSSGLTREASTLSSAMVERSVAAQLSATEARRAATKMPSTCGTRAVQENENPPCREVMEHCVSSTVTTARIGREAAFVIQATRAGRASRSRCLLRIGRNDVKRVATSAKSAAMICLRGTDKHDHRPLILSCHALRPGNEDYRFIPRNAEEWDSDLTPTTATPTRTLSTWAITGIVVNMDFHQLLLSPDLTREGETAQITTRTERLLLTGR